MNTFPILERWSYLTPEDSMAELFGNLRMAEQVRDHMLKAKPADRWERLPKRTLMELTIKLLPIEDLVSWVDMTMVSFRDFITRNREAKAELDDGQGPAAQVAIDRAMVLASMTPFSDAERQAVKEQIALYRWVASKYDASMYGDKKAGVTDMIPAIIVPPALGPGINPQTCDAQEEVVEDPNERPLPMLGANLESALGELRVPRASAARAPRQDRL